MKVKGIQYLENGGAELIDVEVGEPGAGEIQVEVAACGICAWDIQTCRTGTKGPWPAPPGHEGVAYVTKLGHGVEGFEAGERVVAGGFVEVANVRARGARKIPASDLPDEAWIVEPVACIVNGLDHCRLRPADRVALIGCGFMGLMFVQALRGSYADRLIAIDVRPERLELARKLGADEVRDASGAGANELGAELKALGIDTVVDTTGSQGGLDLATEIVRTGGRINLFGWIKGEGRFDGGKWHMGGITVVNSSPSARERDIFEPAMKLIERGVIDLRPLVTHVVPLAEYPALMQKLVAGEPGYIKGVVKPGA
jgi:threonine dehydrogenase-like Zn-dependent dehydrogenase